MNPVVDTTPTSMAPEKPISSDRIAPAPSPAQGGIVLSSATANLTKDLGELLKTLEGLCTDPEDAEADHDSKLERNGAGGALACSNALRSATDVRRLSLTKSAKATNAFTQSLLALGPNQSLGALIDRPSLPLPYLLPELIETLQTEMKSLEEALQFYEVHEPTEALLQVPTVPPLEAE
jgi:hypothetical protein